MIKTIFNAIYAASAFIMIALVAAVLIRGCSWCNKELIEELFR